MIGDASIHYGPSPNCLFDDAVLAVQKRIKPPFPSALSSNRRFDDAAGGDDNSLLSSWRRSGILVRSGPPVSACDPEATEYSAAAVSDPVSPNHAGPDMFYLARQRCLQIRGDFSISPRVRNQLLAHAEA